MINRERTPQWQALVDLHAEVHIWKWLQEVAVHAQYGGFEGQHEELCEAMKLIIDSCVPENHIHKRRIQTVADLRKGDVIFFTYVATSTTIEFNNELGKGVLLATHTGEYESPGNPIFSWNDGAPNASLVESKRDRDANPNTRWDIWHLASDLEE